MHKLVYHEGSSVETDIGLKLLQFGKSSLYFSHTKDHVITPIGRRFYKFICIEILKQIMFEVSLHE